MKARAILDAYRKAGRTIAVAESCTGGMLAATLTDPAGASDVFLCGYITYSNAAKTDMLGVLPETLDRFGAVSEEIAREMAEGALARSGAAVAVAVTGIAGPGPSEHKPEGRVCFALAAGDSPTQSLTHDFGAIGRAKVRQVSVDTALSMLSGAC